MAEEGCTVGVDQEGAQEWRFVEIQVMGEVRLPEVRGKKGMDGQAGGLGLGVPLSPLPSQAFALRQNPLPVTYQRGLIVHVHHGVLQRRKPKQTTS